MGSIGRGLCLAILVAGVAWGCKDGGSDSEVESLSELEAQAGGAAASDAKACSGDHPINGGLALSASSIVGAGDLRSNVTAALSSVPTSVTFSFFQYAGTVQVTDDVAGACAGESYSLTGSEQSDGCLIVKPGEQLTAVIAANPASIRKAVTRIFGLYVSYGGARASMQNGELVLDDPEPATTAFWNGLKSTALREIAARPGVSTESAAYKSVAEMDAEDIYPHAFDSYFCDKNYQAAERAKYPDSMNLMNQHAKSIAAIDRALLTALKTRDLSEFDRLNSDPVTNRFAAVVRAQAELSLNSDFSGDGFGLVKRPLAGFVRGQPLRNIGRGAFNIGRRGANLFRRH